MLRNGARLTWLILVTAAGALPAVGQENQPPKNPFEGPPLGWQVEPIIDWHVRQMARHYNLSERQEQYTRELMTQRVKQFLRDYEKDVRWLAYELWDYQLKKQIPPTEIATDWGQRAKPLLAAMKKEVIEGNMKWREILTEEQKGKHDKDLELMTRQFDEFEATLDRWSHGDVQASDLRGQVSPRALTPRPSEDAWSYYVRSFIQLYNLDEGQKQTAYSHLVELKGEAGRYRAAHREEFAQLEAQEAAIREAEPGKTTDEVDAARKKGEELRKRRRELERPISEGMFNRLKEGLEKIPTTEQRRARELHLSRLEQIGKRPITMTLPAFGSTQPATQPAPATSPKP